MLKKIITLLIFVVAIFKMISAQAVDVPITIFPLNNYNQDVNYWISPRDPDYDKLLINRTTQKKQLKEYYKHSYTTGANALSPWGYRYVKEQITQKLEDSSYITEQKIIDTFGNPTNKDAKKIGYGINFTPYNDNWLKPIIANMNLKQFKLPIKYRVSKRGIAVRNLHARCLPTNDPYYYNFTLPGEGYPYDNLQDSAVWVGTPVYIIGTTRDRQWHLVLTPSFISWVESDGIAKVGPSFIIKWQKHAKQKMVAITKTNLSIFDINNQYRFNAYIGAVFPGKSLNKRTLKVLIPIADKNHNARITLANISKKNARVMPLRATPHNFATIISSLIGRPYGWGNMYFYNDCSAELQSLYTPFGIWLPRNSSAQAKSRKIIDISSLSMHDRIKYLQEKGKKFITIVYVGGHVIMYIGTRPNPNSSTHELVAMTYQTTGGLKPEDNSFRSFIGKSIFFPLLEQYPEEPKVNPQANYKYFQLINVDEPPLNQP